MDIKRKNNRNLARKKRVSMKIKGKNESPRLAVFKSNKFIYAQIVDDSQEKTICQENSRTIKKNKKDAALEVGKKIAEKAAKKNIKKIFFDRARYPYHGRVKALADGAREGGLEF